MRNKKPGTRKAKNGKQKKLILCAYKFQYYAAAALLLNALKEADIEFSAADMIHADLLKLAGSSYSNIYIIGVRLKNDYSSRLKDALDTLVKAGKEPVFYLPGGRIESKCADLESCRHFIKEAAAGDAGDTLIELIKRDFKPEAEAFNRINNIYRLFEGSNNEHADQVPLKMKKYMEYMHEMHFKWDVGDQSGLREMIEKTAFDSVTEEELSRAANYESSEYMLTGDSSAIRGLRKKARHIGRFDIPVMILGETGTGKEYLAGLLHEASGRSGEFVPVNCAAVSPDLIDSTLFGHVKGAFTGAVNTREGVIMRAKGGTLFLDEITEMPPAVQGKLLRFLQDFSFWPLGYDGKALTADVRVITATNADINSLVREKKFRDDLYYRLKGDILRLPPLRQRKEDIKQLAITILYKLRSLQGCGEYIAGTKEFEILESYDWPGNIRQLYRFLQRCVIYGAKGVEMKRLLDEERAEETGIAQGGVFTGASSRIATLAETEKHAIIETLKKTNGNKSSTARALGIALNTLKSKIKEYEIGQFHENNK